MSKFSTVFVMLIALFSSGCTDEISSIQSDIDNHPIAKQNKLWAKVKNFENGYVTIEVDGFGSRAEESFKKGMSLQQIAAFSNARVQILIPIEQVIEKRSDVKDVIWSARTFEPPSQKDRIGLFRKHPVITDKSMLGLSKGMSLKSVKEIYGEPDDQQVKNGRVAAILYSVGPLRFQVEFEKGGITSMSIGLSNIKSDIKTPSYAPSFKGVSIGTPISEVEDLLGKARDVQIAREVCSSDTSVVGFQMYSGIMLLNRCEKVFLIHVLNR